MYAEEQNSLSLSPGYVLGDSRAVLFFVLGRFVPPVVKSSDNDTVIRQLKYCIFFSNRRSVPISAPTVQYPRSLTKDAVSVEVLLSNR